MRELCDDVALAGALSSRAVHLPPLAGRLIQCFMYKRSSPNDNHYVSCRSMLPAQYVLALRKLVEQGHSSHDPRHDPNGIPCLACRRTPCPSRQSSIWTRAR
jgi:hypothetical protein